MADNIAGRNSAVPVPASSATTSVISKLPTKTTATNAAARTTSATTTHHLRDQRSAAAPASGPRTIVGRNSASRMRLMAHGDRQRS